MNEHEKHLPVPCWANFSRVFSLFLLNGLENAIAVLYLFVCLSVCIFFAIWHGIFPLKSVTLNTLTCSLWYKWNHLLFKSGIFHKSIFRTPNFFLSFFVQTGYPRFQTFTFLQHGKSEMFVNKAFKDDPILVDTLLYNNAIPLHCRWKNDNVRQFVHII